MDFDFFNFGQGAQIEDGPYVELFQRSDPGSSNLGGLGGAEEEIGPGRGGSGNGGGVTAQGAEVVDTFYGDEGG